MIKNTLINYILVYRKSFESLWSLISRKHKAGRILILFIKIGADQYILINLYNVDTETEQVKILEELQSHFVSQSKHR